jgi:hypothetical protein
LKFEFWTGNWEAHRAESLRIPRTKTLYSREPAILFFSENLNFHHRQRTAFHFQFHNQEILPFQVLVMTDDKHEGLQLVPEVILKRKHDMDEMKAHRTAQLLANPRGNKKVFSSKTKVIKVHKPETILTNARAQRNHAIRYSRVLKKGMQKRASDKAIMKNKVIMPDDLAEADQEDEMKREVSYTANSVGSKMVFVIRIRDPNGMPQKVKKILNGMKLKSANEVSTMCWLWFSVFSVASHFRF